MSKLKYFDELAEMELRDPDALYAFCEMVRDVAKELSWALHFQADMLQGDLATVPVPEGRFGSLSSKARAKAVASCLRMGGDAVMHAGRLSVKCYGVFRRHYLEPGGVDPKKPKFKLPA